MASRTTARHTDPFWPVGATGTAPGERPKTAAALDAAARTALRASGEVVPAPAPRGRHTPGGVRHPIGHRTDLGAMWMEAQYGLCGASQPRHSPARGGGGTPREHPVPRRREPAGSDGVVPD